MALNKTEMTEYGVEASYWKIGMVSVDRINNVGSVSIMLYKDRTQSKTNPKKFFIDKVCYFDDKVFPSVFENMTVDLYSMLYEYIKTNEEYFKDATDDLE